MEDKINKTYICVYCDRQYEVAKVKSPPKKRICYDCKPLVVGNFRKSEKNQ